MKRRLDAPRDFLHELCERASCFNFRKLRSGGGWSRFRGHLESFGGWFGGRFGLVGDRLGSRSGFVWGSFWVRLESVWVSFGDRLGIVWGVVSGLF